MNRIESKTAVLAGMTVASFILTACQSSSKNRESSDSIAARQQAYNIGQRVLQEHSDKTLPSHTQYEKLDLGDSYSVTLTRKLATDTDRTYKVLSGIVFLEKHGQNDIDTGTVSKNDLMMIEWKEQSCVTASSCTDIKAARISNDYGDDTGITPNWNISPLDKLPAGDATAIWDELLS